MIETNKDPTRSVEPNLAPFAAQAVRFGRAVLRGLRAVAAGITALLPRAIDDLYRSAVALAVGGVTLSIAAFASALPNVAQSDCLAAAWNASVVGGAMDSGAIFFGILIGLLAVPRLDDIHCWIFDRRQFRLAEQHRLTPLRTVGTVFGLMIVSLATVGMFNEAKRYLARDPRKTFIAETQVDICRADPVGGD